ncbi:MAG: hypothetical protein ACFFE5_03660 [Candidatus Thorarchaeota archaeon]
MKEQKADSQFEDSHPRILEIKDKEIKEKKPPIDNIAYYKIIDANKGKMLEEK